MAQESFDKGEKHATSSSPWSSSSDGGSAQRAGQPHPGFASSFSAFFPTNNTPLDQTAFTASNLSDYPLFSNRRTSFGHSQPQLSSISATGNYMTAFSSSKLRRQSILASSVEDEDSMGQPGDDDADMGMTDEVDMEMEANDGLQMQPAGNMGRTIMPIPSRARSLSQSTVSKSPPWPNSPPRGNQHILARLASEQQQALAASASSPYFLMPSASRLQDDLIVEDSSAVENDHNMTDDAGDEVKATPVPFNPLNPHQLKNSSHWNSGHMASNEHDPPEDGARQGGHMVDTPHIARDTTQAAPSNRSMSSDSFDPLSAYDSSLRPSRASPASSRPASTSDTGQLSGMDQRPGGSANTIPSTPPPLGLRRSQSASVRLSSLAGFTSTSPGPQTAPLSQLLEGGSFPLRTRSSSFSGGMSPWRGDTRISNLAAGDSSMNMDGPRDQDRGQSSGSETTPQPKVVRRPVNHKKGSLMPKSKDHLRIMSQLRLETGEFEVASEAALHRINQSTPALPNFLSPRHNRDRSNSSSGPRPGYPYFQPLPSNASGAPSARSGGGSDGRPASSSGRLLAPTKNRFPESAVEEEDNFSEDSSGSERDYSAVADIGSDTGMCEDEDAMSAIGLGDGQEAAPGRPTGSAWSLRDPSSNMWGGQVKPSTPITAGARPGPEADVSPSSILGWSSLSAARPGKRKLDSDRFEPYTTAFKRRAVSPASTSVSSVSLSPLLTQANIANLPLPLPSSFSTLGPPASISAQTTAPVSGNQLLPPSVPPSPIIGSGTWLSRSRASSPAPSLSSSIGASRRWANANADDEAKPPNKVDLGKMSLG